MPIAEAFSGHRFREAYHVLARHVDADGGVTLVSSCDVFEFLNGALTAITSYAVEVEPESSDTRGFALG